MANDIEVRRFFNRPGPEVVGELAQAWVWPDQREIFQPGRATMVFKIRMGEHEALAFWRADLVELYSHEYTMERWPDRRGPEIARLEPGEIIGYPYRGYLLPFIHTQEGKAENIFPRELRRVDKNGFPMAGKAALITQPSKIATLFGLTPVLNRARLKSDPTSPRGFIVLEEDLSGLEEAILRVNE